MCRRQAESAASRPRRDQNKHVKDVLNLWSSRTSQVLSRCIRFVDAPTLVGGGSSAGRTPNGEGNARHGLGSVSQVFAASDADVSPVVRLISSTMALSALRRSADRLPTRAPRDRRRAAVRRRVACTVGRFSGRPCRRNLPLLCAWLSSPCPGVVNGRRHRIP